MNPYNPKQFFNLFFLNSKISIDYSPAKDSALTISFSFKFNLLNIGQVKAFNLVNLFVDKLIAYKYLNAEALLINSQLLISFFDAFKLTKYFSDDISSILYSLFDDKSRYLI